MPAFTTVLGLAAVAGSLVNAAPVAAPRAQPSNYYTPYLEPYDAYHLRYLALDCQDKHDTDFFEQCCHPLVVADGQTLADRPAYCTPNATEIASASSYTASTAESGAQTTSTPAAGNGSPAPTTSSDDGGASEYCEDEPSTSTTLASTPVPVNTPSTTSTSTSSSTTSSTSTSTTSHHPHTSPSSSVDVDSDAQTSTAQALTTEAALAPTTTSTTQQAQPTTTSSANNNNNGGNSGVPSGANYGGYATFFYQNGNPGACGNYNPDSKPLVAIDQAWWGGNFGQVSQYCGKYVTIQNTQNGKTVVAEVQDVCPTCANGNSLDLSTGAFNQIAEEWQGQVPIVWWFN